MRELYEFRFTFFRSKAGCGARNLKKTASVPGEDLPEGPRFAEETRRPPPPPRARYGTLVSSTGIGGSER